jgi:hypothetical protein
MEKTNQVKKNLGKSLLAVIAIAALALLATSAYAQQEVVTSKGKFPLNANGAPEKETIQALFDEMDYQPASGLRTFNFGKRPKSLSAVHNSATP